MSDLHSFESLARADANARSGECVLFDVRAVLNPRKSEEAGRPIHDDVEYITIFWPGDKTKEIVRPVRTEDKAKYAPEYTAFQEKREQLMSGTPLSAWGVLHESTVADLRAIKVFTVEQLAGLSELGIGNLGMGAHDMVAKAKAYLNKGTEAERLRAQVAELTRQLADLQAQLADKPRRGRPPKEVTENADAA